jgi:Domain of unknown function (DUF1996)
MAYPDPARGDTKGGICPKSHPVALISIGAEFGFDTASLGLTTSEGLVLANGDTTGYGFHGDFLQGWTNLTALQNSFANCTGIGSACAWNSFGTPNGQQGQKSMQVPEVPAIFEEEIGLNGPLTKLPGNNPVFVPGSSVTTPPSTSQTKIPGPSTSSTPVIFTSVPTTLKVVASSTSSLQTSTHTPSWHCSYY